MLHILKMEQACSILFHDLNLPIGYFVFCKSVLHVDEHISFYASPLIIQMTSFPPFFLFSTGYGIFYWTSNNEGSSGHTGVELIEINDAVKAIRVLCSGWYYVYAQVPYKQTESYSVTTGHKIIRREKCGRSNEEVVLQTSVTLDGRTPQ